MNFFFSVSHSISFLSRSIRRLVFESLRELNISAIASLGPVLSCSFTEEINRLGKINFLFIIFLSELTYG